MKDTHKFLAVVLFLALTVATNSRILSGGRIPRDHLGDFFSEFRHEEPQDVRSCPCDNELLCLPLEEAKRRDDTAPHVQIYKEKINRTEVFAFVLNCDINVWSKFDWKKLTTIATAGFYDPDLVCHAHRHGVKVVKLGNIPTTDLPNPAARLNWANVQASDVALKFLDGINIDYEDAIADGSPEQKGLTSLVQETSEVFHNNMPGSQVSIDVAWQTGGVDGRFYDYAGIANASDLIFIMAYDEQSQIFDKPCSARANAGIYKTAAGIQSYVNLGIPPEKMILGVPWYGYNYPCESLDSNETCYIKEVPFRGVNCSDAAGKEYPYSFMMSTMQKYHATYHWDKNTLTPFYTIKDDSGQVRQMRYDDARSLAYKYMLAVASGLRGVGMWTANFLDYDDSPTAVEQQNLMWGLLP